MSTERDLLPRYERDAAHAAIQRVVEETGSQTAAGIALGVSQNAVNKALLYKKVGPTVMRVLLDYLKLDVRGLVERYGDPSELPAHAGATEETRPKSIKEEAIAAGIRYGGGVREEDVREIADRFEPILEGQPIIAWVETILREIQRTLVRPKLEQKAARRAQKSEQRAVRTMQAARRARGAAAHADASEAKKASR